MCAAIILHIFQLGWHLSKMDFLKLGLKAVLNVTLLQTWFPHNSINQSLNGVAWYLSVSAFLYFSFPWLEGRIKRSNKKLLIQLLTFFTVEISFTYVTLLVTSLESPVYIWPRYYFPVFRIGDYYAGCIMYKLLYTDIECRRKCNSTLFLLICFAATAAFVCIEKC